jgi:hypothetical protein
LGHEDHVRPLSDRPDYDFGIVVQPSTLVVTGQDDGNRFVVRMLEEWRDSMPIPGHPTSARDQDERCLSLITYWLHRNMVRGLYITRNALFRVASGSITAKPNRDMTIGA